MRKQFPKFHQDMTIQEIGEEANRYIESEWKPLYESMHTDLAAALRK